MCKPLPVSHDCKGMSSMHVVHIPGRIYCGCGYRGENSKQDENFIYMLEYTISQNKKLSFPCNWKKLPINVEKCALVQYEKEGTKYIVALGGTLVSGSIVKDVYAYSVDGWKEDIQTFGRLSEERLWPAAANYNTKYIIVCGGSKYKDPIYKYNRLHDLDSVEIYDGDGWKELTSTLPMRTSGPSIAIIGESCFVIGGSYGEDALKSAAKISLTDIYSSKWTSMENCPLAGSTAVSVGDALLIIGGKNTTLPVYTLVEDQIYVYDNESKKWNSIGFTKKSVYYAGAAFLDESKFILIGGQDGNNSPIKDVYIGTLQLNWNCT